MKRLLCAMLSVIMLCGMVFAVAEGTEADTGAVFLTRVTGTEGTVTVWDTAGQSFDATACPFLYNGFTVSTGEGSSAWIAVDQAKTCRLEENTAVAVIRTDHYVRLTVLYGTIFVDVSEKLADGDAMELVLPDTVAAIRGTQVICTAVDAGSGVYVHEGVITARATPDPWLLQVEYMTRAQESQPIVSGSGSNSILSTFARISGSQMRYSTGGETGNAGDTNNTSETAVGTMDRDAQGNDADPGESVMDPVIGSDTGREDLVAVGAGEGVFVTAEAVEYAKDLPSTAVWYDCAAAGGHFAARIVSQEFNGDGAEPYFTVRYRCGYCGAETDAVVPAVYIGSHQVEYAGEYEGWPTVYKEADLCEKVVRYVAPTCEADGSKVTLCEGCGMVYETKKAGRALGHDFGEPTVAWKLPAADLKRVCKRDPAHEETMACEVTAETVKMPTCEERGQRIYTATAVWDGITYTFTRDVGLTPYGHHYTSPVFAWTGTEKAKVTLTCGYDNTHRVTYDCKIKSFMDPAPTCTEDGIRKYVAECMTLMDIFTDEKTETIPATGHKFAAPTFTWTEAYTAAATRVCANDAGHTETKDCAVTSAVTKEPTCTEEGVRTYTATVDFDGTAYTSEKTEAIPATGHKYGAPAIAWTGADTASATRVCENDAGHTETKDCDVTSAVTKEPTCTEEGVRTYTATVDFDGTVYTSEKTEAIPVIGHTAVIDPAVPAACGVPGKTEGSHCGVCGAVITAQQDIPALTHEYETTYTLSQSGTPEDPVFSMTGVIVCRHCHDETARKVMPGARDGNIIYFHFEPPFTEQTYTLPE